MEIGWTEIIVAVIGICGVDTGVVYLVARYFFDRRERAESGKVDAETDKETLGNVEDAMDLVLKFKGIVEAETQKAVAPLQQQMKEQTMAYNELSGKFQEVLDELNEWGCYRGFKRAAGPRCEQRLPKVMLAHLPDDDQETTEETEEIGGDENGKG